MTALRSGKGRVATILQRREKADEVVLDTGQGEPRVGVVHHRAHVEYHWVNVKYHRVYVEYHKVLMECHGVHVEYHRGCMEYH